MVTIIDPPVIRQYDVGRLTRTSPVHMLISTGHPCKTLCGINLQWNPKFMSPMGPERISIMADPYDDNREDFSWITCKRCKKMTV